MNTETLYKAISLKESIDSSNKKIKEWNLGYNKHISLITNRDWDYHECELTTLAMSEEIFDVIKSAVINHYQNIIEEGMKELESL